MEGENKTHLPPSEPRSFRNLTFKGTLMKVEDPAHGFVDSRTGSTLMCSKERALHVIQHHANDGMH